MSGYLLDTNVISELASAAPDSKVLNFLSANNDLWIPVVDLYEIEYGLRILPNGRRRRRLEATMSAFVERYAERILRLDREAAECAGALCADARRPAAGWTQATPSSPARRRREAWPLPRATSKISITWTSPSPTLGSSKPYRATQAAR